MNKPGLSKPGTGASCFLETAKGKHQKDQFKLKVRIGIDVIVVKEAQTTSYWKKTQYKAGLGI